MLAALTAAGVRTLGEDARGRPRGAWCGMGACQACLIEVDGAPNQRACMVKVRDGMRVEPAGKRATLTAGEAYPPRRADELPLAEPQLLVVGAGPAGLAAATVARRAGVDVLLLDERAQAGGQYFKQRAVSALPAPDAQQREGARRIAAAEATGVRMLFGATLWGAFPGPELIAATPAGPLRIRPHALILATGAIESGWPVEGWTLPGVMTTGAAQTLWRTARRLPPGRVVIAGNGPLNLQLAAELIGGGAEVTALIEAAPGPMRIASVARMAVAAPGLVAKGIAYRTALMRARVPLIGAAQVTAIHDAGDALSITLDDGRVLAADTLCLGYGLAPADELARALGCTGPRDGEGATPVPGIWRIGDGAAIGGAHVAAAEGRIAGAAAARALGHPADPGDAPRTLARHRRFQAALWRLYAPARPLVPATSPDTVVCRCEGVRRRDIDAARAEGCTSMAAVKQATRAGMGVCQGRYCAPVLAALTGDDRGLAPRVPIRPVTIGDLAR